MTIDYVRYGINRQWRPAMVHVEISNIEFVLERLLSLYAGMTLNTWIVTLIMHH